MIANHFKPHPYLFAGLNYPTRNLLGASGKPATVQILNVVSDVFGLSVDQIVSKSRKREIVWARQCAMYLLRKTLQMTLTDIAKELNRDHATVMHGVKNWANQMQYEDTLRLHIKVLEKL